jgi:hypothetical protein
MPQHMSADAVRDLLRAFLEGKRHSYWAKQWGVSGPYLSMVLKGKKPPGPKILKALNLGRVTVYRAAPLGKRRTWRATGERRETPKRYLHSPRLAGCLPLGRSGQPGHRQHCA